jgi:O-antigen chain-terminating methyltransferase
MEAFSEHFRGDSAELARQFSWIVNWLNENLSENSTLVDLGGGSGYLLSSISKSGLKKINVDSNSNYACSEIDENIHFINQNMFEYLDSIQNGSVDCFILSHVIEHLDFNDAYSLINLIKAKTKIGGFFVLATPNIETIHVLSTFWLDPTHVRPYPKLLLQFMLQYSGFEIIEDETDTPVLPNLSPITDLLTQTLTKLFGDQNLTLICKNILKP